MKCTRFVVTVGLLGFVLVANLEAQEQATTNQEQQAEDVYVFWHEDSENPPPSRDGVNVVVGKILGRIVQKAEVETKPSEDDSTKTSYHVEYDVTWGQFIKAIDENGFHVASARFLKIMVTQDDGLPSDIEILKQGINLRGLFNFTSGGGMITRLAGRLSATLKPTTVPLLGEFWQDQTTGERSVIPAIRIMTADGEITIPVENFVKFKKNPDESK